MRTSSKGRVGQTVSTGESREFKGQSDYSHWRRVDSESNDASLVVVNGQLGKRGDNAEVLSLNYVTNPSRSTYEAG